VLPLTASRNLPDRKLGTRHRAALGISEVSDAVCVVVSEETGRISITNGGRMIPRLDTKRLRTILQAFYGAERSQSTTPWARLREMSQNLLVRFQDWRKRA
jgi:diadenylate cyclase